MKISLSAFGVLSLCALLITFQPELINNMYQENFHREYFMETEEDSPNVFDREYDIVIPNFKSPIQIPPPPQFNTSNFNSYCRADSIDYRSHQGQSPYVAKKGNLISRARIV